MTAAPGLAERPGASALSRRPGERATLLVGAALLLALALLPTFLNAYGVQVVMVGLYVMVLALSWNLLAGYAGQFSVAQHAFATIGAYSSAAVVLSAGLPLGAGVVVGVIVSALLGYLLGWLTLSMRGVYFAVSTWAFAETVRLLLSINYQLTRGDNGLPVPFLFGASDPKPAYYTFLATAAGAFALIAVLLRTKLGYRIWAIRDDQELALANGVNVVRWKRVIFLLSAALAGLAGALYGHAIGLLSPSQAHFSQMAFVIIAVVLGGFRTLWGPVIGAFLLQGLAEGLRFSVEWRLVIYGLAVLLIVRFYPPGIMGLIAAAGRAIQVGRSGRGPEAGPARALPRGQ